MTVTSAVASFALVAGLLTVVPGLDTALVLRSALLQGRRNAFATALGVGSGALVWGAGAAVGVSALLTASEVAYTALRLGGALYMVGLGLRLLRGAAARSVAGADDAQLPEPVAESAWRSWSRGFVTNLLNPKIGAFYVAVLPQFVPPDTPALAMGLLLALVHDLEGMLWFTALILGAERIGPRLRRRAARRAVDGVTGSVLVGFGLRLGLTRP